MEIQQLRADFIGRGEVRGFHFKQVYKSNKAYIYEVLSSSKPLYEVFERKIHRRFQCEIYPKSHHFGEWAWYCHTMKKAMEYVTKIEKKK